MDRRSSQASSSSSSSSSSESHLHTNKKKKGRISQSNEQLTSFTFTSQEKVCLQNMLQLTSRVETSLLTNDIDTMELCEFISHEIELSTTTTTTSDASSSDANILFVTDCIVCQSSGTVGVFFDQKRCIPISSCQKCGIQSDVCCFSLRLVDVRSSDSIFKCSVCHLVYIKPVILRQLLSSDDISKVKEFHWLYIDKYDDCCLFCSGHINLI